MMGSLHRFGLSLSKTSLLFFSKTESREGFDRLSPNRIGVFQWQ
jgi:hypothetical protein